MNYQMKEALGFKIKHKVKENKDRWYI